MARGTIHIGTSGWHYTHWVGPFYPQGMPPSEFLGSYARRFATVEVNNTFYQLPSPKTLADWRAGTPAGFVFACKASRYITHMKKLKDPSQSTEKFFRAIDGLGDKLGPVLFQLPPRWRADAQRLARFLKALPKGYRFAFEFRDESWFNPEIHDLLAGHNAAFCAYDLDRRRSPVTLTADFAYVRLHGPGGPYRGTYDGRTLSGWARRFTSWSGKGIDVYCYFDNDEMGYAALDARRILEMIGDISGGLSDRNRSRSDRKPR
jgi:uncharacterized protein YecE (DUF72 family)